MLAASLAAVISLATTVVASAASAAPVTPPAMDELEPGVTFRMWDVERPLDRVHEPAPGEAPNLDERRDVIDYPARGGFGGFGDRFIVEVTGWLLVDDPGVHVFRLTSDDGSLLSINGERVIWNRGRLTKEEQELKLRFFELRGVEDRQGDLGGDMLLMPTEQQVLALAGRWSFDPSRLEDATDKTAGLGYLCTTPSAWRSERVRRSAA